MLGEILFESVTMDDTKFCKEEMWSRDIELTSEKEDLVPVENDVPP